MSSIQWDPRSNGFMLSSSPYENKILYIHGSPEGFVSRAHHRMNLWFWDYTEKERTHLPPLYYQIHRAAIHNHILYVVVKSKKKFTIYSLDLSEKNHEWVKLQTLTTSHQGSGIKLIPYLQDSRKNDLIIVYEDKLVLFNRQTNSKQAFAHEFLYYDENILKVFFVGDKLYVIRETHLLVYDVDSEEIEEEEHFDDFAGYAYQGHNCQDACVHVYDERFILIVCENKIIEDDKPFYYWFVAVYDCQSYTWIHSPWRQGYEIFEYERHIYAEGIRNYLWHENSLCFMHCERNEDDYLHLDRHITNATTIQHHISYYLPNWEVIKIYLCMRYLVDKKRATVKQECKDTYEGMLYDFLGNDEFRLVLDYLVCKDKDRYIVAFE